MAIQKITADVIATSAVTTDSLSDSSITAAKLHTTLDLTGKTVTVATASAGDNDTTVASTAFVSTAIANLADSAPSTLDTLNELAAALGDDANFSTTVTNSIATKLPLAGGTLTGNLNFGDSDKAVFGAGSDLQISHDGLHSKIQDVGTGDLKIQATNLLLEAQDGTNYIYAVDGTAVRLYHPDATNGIKLATTSTGIDVTGTATMDGLTVDGNGVFSATSGDTLTLKKTTGASLVFNNTTAATAAITAINGADGMDFRVGSAQAIKARLDSSGNLLVGKTGLAIGTVGTEVRNNGQLLVTANGDNPVDLNRLTSDGTIANFRKDGTTVGSIRSVGGGYTMYNSESGTGYLGVNGTATYGWDATKVYHNTDATGDLGSTSRRFKDLYLSGTANAAKLKLDNPSSFTNMIEYGNVTWNQNTGHGLVAINRGSDGYVQLQLTSGVDNADVFTIRNSGTGANVQHNLLSNGNAYHAGNVGIGTTSPVSPLQVNVGTNLNLGVNEDSSTLRLSVYDDAASSSQPMTINSSSTRFDISDTETMRIDSGGHVIIGSNLSTTEGGKLSVYTDATNDAAIYGYRSTSYFRIVPFLSNGAFSSLSNVNDSGLFFSDNFVIAKHATGNYGAIFHGNGSIFIGTESEATGSTGGASFSADSYDRRNLILATTSTGNLELVEFRNPNGTVGTIKSNGTSTSYNTSSDYRLKENIDYDFTALDRVAQLKPARFNFITDEDTILDGFLAHEVSSIVPEAVSGEKDATKEEEYEITPAQYEDDGETLISEAVMGTRTVPVYQGIDQSKLVPLLTKAIQELSVKLEAAEARITELEG
jgi:hypothetical protein